MEDTAYGQDIEDMRKPATSMREYLGESTKSIRSLGWIWRTVTSPESRKWTIKMMLALCAVIVFQTLMPASVKFIYEGLDRQHHDLHKVLWGMGSFAAFLFLVKFIERIQYIAREWMIGIHRTELAHYVAAKFFGLSIGQHLQHADLLSSSNINKGKGKVLEVQDMMLFNGIQVITQLAVSYVCLWILSPVAGASMTLVVLAYGFWSLFLNYRINEVCIPLDREFRRLERRRTERYDMMDRVKMNAKEDHEVNEMTVIFKAIMKKDIAFWLWYITQINMRSMVNGLGLVGTMSWGVYLVWIGEWEIGWLYPLFAWTMKFCENVWQLGDVEHRINWNMPVVQTMQEALSIPPAIVDAPDAKVLDRTVAHRIEFVNVSHTYRSEGMPALKVVHENGDTNEEPDEQSAAVKRVSFVIEPGKKAALLGQSGCGKTTLMRNLLRAEDPTSGEILVDGINLRDITRKSWLEGIGYIAQQPQVFDGTVRYNLTYGMAEEDKAKITDEELWETMRLLQIDFKGRLTHGLETQVGKNGLQLSGGQAQRLMIGAAVLKNPWLLVIDEATSSLDSINERKVQAGLEKVLAKRSISALIVAHRLSTVRNTCDTFVMLKPAEEVRNGDSQVDAIASSFEELAVKSPRFKELAFHQDIHLLPLAA